VLGLLRVILRDNPDLLAISYTYATGCIRVSENIQCRKSDFREGMALGSSVNNGDLRPLWCKRKRRSLISWLWVQLHEVE
jgi:hypothetical protein